jgi:predicted phage-related endonuclease
MNREVWQITSRGEWLDRRRGLLTASRIAALFDAHAYLSRADLAGTITGTHNEGDNAAMRRGRILESAVVEVLREEHPAWVIERATTFHSIPSLRLGATPDAFFTDENGERGLIQIKTADPEIWQRWNGRPPLAYQLQTLTEMMCCDLDRGILAVMITNRSLPVYEFAVPRHPAAEAKLLEAAAAWWQEWDAGRIAPAASSDGLQALLDDGSTIDLSSDSWLAGALWERQEMKADINAREKRCAEIDAYIKNAMGQATYASLPGWAITFRAHERAERLVPAATIRALRIRHLEEEP